ncbi:hypothetical protein IVB34_47900 [Bradyrhizobium sp. 2]|uniref:hypothetical protein n=1 Tax=Bradyrhizobium sp. 2 TaxID=190045 RepID=UPI001FFA3DD4|nr:hypothetical protein [Bradyrhizobium sp. 2]MCK1465812.1 hypothetical protein [Bradyrhizobium sp. 2]
MTPLHLIVTRMKRLPLRRKLRTSRPLSTLEKPCSIRRSELEAMLKGHQPSPAEA